MQHTSSLPGQLLETVFTGSFVFWVSLRSQSVRRVVIVLVLWIVFLYWEDFPEILVSHSPGEIPS